MEEQSLRILLLGILLYCSFIVLCLGLQRFFNTKPYWPRDLSLLRQLRTSSFLFFISVTAWLVCKSQTIWDLPSFLEGTLRSASILLITWNVIRVIDLMKWVVYNRFDVNTADNLSARKVRTQLEYVEKLVDLLVWILGIAATLMTFEDARNIGNSLLASAGIASVVIGFAAQKSIGNIFAGLQIAFTQPLRMDDVVVIEGEWGRIEEITLTYIVVRIWDLRRLVVPITYFIEKPFENWTRTSASILGYVNFEFDYTLPVGEFRREFERQIKTNKNWDNQVANIQVVNCGEKTMTLRALMSSRDSSAAWDLRCEVREAMIAYVQQKYPQSLPLNRLTGAGNMANSTKT